MATIDGDSIRGKATLWPSHTWQGTVRLRGIDTPELRGYKCPAEKEQAILSRDTLTSLIPEFVGLRNVERDKYGGRVVATVVDGDHDMADVLMQNATGRPYHGGKRKPWCNESRDSITERVTRMKPSHPSDTAAAAKAKAYLQALADQATRSAS